MGAALASGSCTGLNAVMVDLQENPKCDGYMYAMEKGTRIVIDYDFILEAKDITRTGDRNEDVEVTFALIRRSDNKEIRELTKRYGESFNIDVGGRIVDISICMATVKDVEPWRGIWIVSSQPIEYESEPIYG